LRFINIALLLFGISFFGTSIAQDDDVKLDPRLKISPIDWYKDRSRVNPPNAFSACNRQYSYSENKVVACEYGALEFCKAKSTDDPVEACASACTAEGIKGDSVKQCFYGCFAAQEYGGCAGTS